MLTHTVVYPGTFDPITNGHIDLVERREAVRGVVVALLPVRKKPPFLQIPGGTGKACLQHVPAARSCPLTGCSLTCDRAGLPLCAQGLRAVADFEYEFQLANMNRAMDPEFESVLTPSAELSYIFVMVREIAGLAAMSAASCQQTCGSAADKLG